MKKILIVCTLVSTAWRCSPVLADPPPPRRELPPVRIVDFGKYFAKCAWLQRSLKAIDEEAAMRRNELLASYRAELRSKDDERRGLTVEQIQACEEELKVRVCGECRPHDYALKQEIRRREAELYSSAYRELLDEIRVYCKYEGIQVILRLDPPGSHPALEVGCTLNPDIRVLDRAILHYDPALDITDLLLAEVNREITAIKVPVKALPPRR